MTYRCATMRAAIFWLIVGGLSVVAARAHAVEIVLPKRGLCAHRGASVSHPENTLAAFHEAIRLGAHMIEFDVALTSDGQLVLMHDATIDRTTNGTGPVSAHTLEQLQALDVGSWKDESFAGEQIPTLQEALEIMPVNVWLNVHLKGDTRLAEETTRAIVANKRLNQAFLACGTQAADAARAIEPQILICNMDRQGNSREYAERTIELDAEFIQLAGGKGVEPALAALLAEQGVRINYFGTNDADELRSLFAAGVEFPLVDDVAAMMPVAEELGIKRLSPITRFP